MVSSYFKRLWDENHKTYFSTQENMVFFYEGFNLLGKYDKEDIILEPYYEDEHGNMVSLIGTSHELFNLNFLIIHK